jgi:arylsulfatase I/J
MRTTTAGLPLFLLALFASVVRPDEARPNLIHVIVDDLGWSYRPGPSNDNAESVTPNLDGLVADGIWLDRFYAHKICSPSRSAFLSGRDPVHVNVENALPEIVNPADPVGGFQGVPPNMTLVGELMKRGGYTTR